MAFTVNRNFISIDRTQFMNSSLDASVKSMSDIDFRYLSQKFSSELLELVKQKGVYPYEYMNNFKKCFDDRLPDRPKFYSSLKDKCVSDKDYLYAVNVWNMFELKTIGNYYDLYLKADVLLLTDVFEKFIDVCSEYYGLDLYHYFSSPGLSWDAMLKMNGVELEVISEVDMYLLVEKGVRDGISYIGKRYSKANNKYMKSYDDSKSSKFVTYLDTNNLYGWTSSQYLPYSGFK